MQLALRIDFMVIKDNVTDRYTSPRRLETLIEGKVDVKAQTMEAMRMSRRTEKTLISLMGRDFQQNDSKGTVWSHFLGGRHFWTNQRSVIVNDVTGSTRLTMALHAETHAMTSSDHGETCRDARNDLIPDPMTSP